MSSTPSLRSVAATRYVTPLREGGSLPGIVEADDSGLYVVKFRGAGQGPLALVAEILTGELARALGLPVPEQVLVELDPTLGLAEPDPEIKELILASAGTNLGLDFLPGSATYSPGAGFDPEPETAAAIVWLDALMSNVDRTAQNPNMLVWHGRLWLIDHGAALYQQHRGLHPGEQAGQPFAQIRDHVLLALAGSIAEADAQLAPLVTPELLEAILALVPEQWLAAPQRATYFEYLTRRVRTPRRFAQEAERVRAGT